MGDNCGEVVIETSKAEFAETCLGSHFEIFPGRYAVVALSDDGCGMDKEVMSHLFEPFFTTKKFGQGAGLVMINLSYRLGQFQHFFPGLKHAHRFSQIFLDQRYHKAAVLTGEADGLSSNAGSSGAHRRRPS